MKKIIKSAWFQILFFGIIIGIILIVIDPTLSIFSKDENKPPVYNGAIRSSTDEMFFTNFSYTETSFDFGQVTEGDTVSHTFKIKNTGSEPLMIYKTKGSCDCIKAYYSDKPILPGEEGDINVFFKTIGRKGKQVRTVSVTTNSEPAESTLTFTGEVI